VTVVVFLTEKTGIPARLNILYLIELLNGCHKELQRNKNEVIFAVSFLTAQVRIE
jgi:hypothetical protein